jgi:hypothetical protein
MGQSGVDAYSVLHFFFGSLAYLLRIPFLVWALIHLAFEIVENSFQGVTFIDQYITWWPGGKKDPDSIGNSISDEIVALLGWLFTSVIDKYINHSNENIFATRS